MPGAYDLVSLDSTLAQRSALMGAGVVDGENLAVQIEQGDPLALDLDERAFALDLFERAVVFGKLRHFGDLDELGHGDPLTFLSFSALTLIGGARLLHPKGFGSMVPWDLQVGSLAWKV